MKTPFRQILAVGAMLLGVLIVSAACGPAAEPTPTEMAPTATMAEESPQRGNHLR